MAEEKQRREPGIPIGGVIILFLGIVFLLQTLNVIPWGLWSTLWRFWPALLIIIGLAILLRRFNPWLVSLLFLAVLFACLGMAIWRYAPSPSADGTLSQSYTQPRDNLERAKVTMDLPVGNLSLMSLPAGSTNLVEAGSRGGRHDAALRADFSREGTTGILKLHLERGDWARGHDDYRWQAGFTRDIPLTMDIKSAASNLDADLGQLRVTGLNMKLDVGNFMLVLPSAAGDGKVSIKVALSNMEITVPAGVAARIKIKADLASVEVDQGRFPKNGDYYVSGDFDTAKNRIDMDVECDLGRIQIK